MLTFMEKKKKSPSRMMIEITPELAQRVRELEKRYVQNPTVIVNSAVREMLERVGLWPPLPGKEKE